jgi:adenosine 3'-phospho 5'-phosphosulfate transporter B3
MTLLQRSSPGGAGTSSSSVDDADVAAGQTKRTLLLNNSKKHQSDVSDSQHSNNNNMMSSTHSTLSTSSFDNGGNVTSAPSSVNTINTATGHPDDLGFYEDLVSEPVLVLGMDISHLNRQHQFVVCAVGVFCFSLLYGYLQELISVDLCGRQLGLFQAMVQFSGYTVLSFFLRTYVYQKQQKMDAVQQASTGSNHFAPSLKVPFNTYLWLSILRAVDLGMTNLAMQYINYPAKTLMKSSRVVFTMMFGVIIAKKTYPAVDYLIVMAMVAGLALFMHADANSSAVFHHIGVVMLTVSLTCDGLISNMSENIMSNYGVGQDEFIFRMYSIALVAISMAAAYKGDFREGIEFMSQPGNYREIHDNMPLEERTWSVPGKIAVMLLFSSMGFFGSSCSACITKNFGALTMSITSTARKATTLFLSFFLFNNICTGEHLVGIFIFITALTTKSLRRGRKKSGSKSHKSKKRSKRNNKKKSSRDNLELTRPSTMRDRASSAESSSGPIRRTNTGTPNKDGDERQEYSIAGLNIV